MALFVTGCSKESTDSNPDKSYLPIHFALQTAETRGTPLTATNLADFGVYAYNTGTTKWANVSTTANSNWINHDVIMHQGNYWIGRATYYWPIDQLLTFFAYAPYSNQYNGITMPTPNADGFSATGIPTIHFEVLPDVMAQTDLLISSPIPDMTAETNKGFVNIRFRHTTTKIGFSVYCATPGTSIQSIGISNSPYKGTLAIINDQDQWSIETGKRDFSLYLNGLIVSTQANDPTDLSAPVSYFMMLPKAAEVSPTANLTITYTMNGKEITKNIPATEEWGMGKSIRYTLNLGGSPADDIIIEKVTIEDWIYAGKVDTELDTKGKIHTLTFDTNGGTAGTVASESWEYGSMPRIPQGATPSLTGQTFKEWNTLQNGGGTSYQPKERIKISGNITLYAQWN